MTEVWNEVPHRRGWVYGEPVVDEDDPGMIRRALWHPEARQGLWMHYARVTAPAGIDEIAQRVIDANYQERLAAMQDFDGESVRVIRPT